MKFELVSPERRLTSTEDATAVRLPGTEGDMTAMADHAPTITSLRPGILTVEAGGTEDSYAVTGGFAEIGAGVTVLAERALHVSDVTQEVLDEWLAEAKQAHKEAHEAGGAEGAVDAAAKLVADMVAMGGHIGLSADASSL
ncbi:F0F1 ATP synthase subunit epsilon [Jannaschia seohaensis]|uniref:ATP synthase epsilon chain n=1 Tax=Jannaschia seohaensis TaxID=475081 RepID=A0A2Y9B6Z5_9RHOB|nr:F0F1 ATP synthase subunit epsilon [Jannaschia seohaensis]PWJ15100.1 F-type H+-transporting ATPase subunit epsilon [Jannaschia seohaensis]SSA49949.1 F-type H+-transporting ATPase subunit epsilon [Jannaschia seohaensis]